MPPQNVAAFTTVTIDEDDVVAMYLNNRAAEALIAGHLYDAYWWAHAAVLKRPAAILAYNTLAVIYERHGDLALAALVQRLTTIEPTPPFNFFNLGVAAYEQGDYPAAQALFSREVKRMPYYDEFHFWLTLASLRLGDLDQARVQLAFAFDTSTRGYP